MLAVGHIAREPGLEGVLKAGQAIAHAEEYVYTFFKDKVDDAAPIPEAVRLTREADVPVILTLVAFDHIIRQAEDLPALLARPETKYLAPWVLADWQPGKNLYEKRFANAEGLAYLKKSLALQKKMVQAMRRAGVRVFVGTDAMNMGVVPGFSVHEELGQLVALGFTPFEALRAATSHPAEFLRPGEFGRIAAGRRADLILVGSDPLKDITTVSRPEGVMARGRWLPAGELRRMLDDVPAAYANEAEFVKADLERDTAAALNYLVENDPFDNLLNEAVAGVVAGQGVGGFRRIFEKVRQPDRGAMLATESFVNGLGYRLLGQNRLKEAIEIFKFNTQAYPKSANTYDSLAEAYLGAGEKKLAFDFYKKALEVDPDYANAPAARDVLKQLEAEATKAAP
jgi:tetratricopeptide (TPR) repeat protein